MSLKNQCKKSFVTPGCVTRCSESNKDLSLIQLQQASGRISGIVGKTAQFGSFSVIIIIACRLPKIVLMTLMMMLPCLLIGWYLG